MLPPRIIVDGDPAVYRAGFASQETHHVLVIENDLQEGDLKEVLIVGDPREEKKRLAKLGWTVLHHERRVVPRDVDIARLSLSAQFRAIYKACVEHFGDGAAYQEIILSGTGNYRNEIATTQGYKANRLKLEKPVHYAAIRDYVVDRWGAYVVNEREADDEVSIRAHRSREDGQPYIIVTIDKDLDQIPGPHYDYKNHVFYDVTPEEATLLFYAQCLSGDPVDNIPGVRGIGPSTAKELVRQWEKQWLDTPKPRAQSTLLELERHLWTGVVETYMRFPLGLPNEAKYEGPKDAEGLALEMARLVWLQRQPGELWTPPGEPREFTKLNADD